MLQKVFKKIVGSRNERLLKQKRKLVTRINALEEAYSALSDEELQAKTGEFRRRLDEGAALDDLLPEAFAVVREASKRTLNMRHFDVQLIGGMVLHDGRIAEMKTGEGKTVVGRLGHIYDSPPEGLPSAAVFRCRTSGGEHFDSFDSTELGSRQLTRALTGSYVAGCAPERKTSFA
jgi:hypothetical protein